MNNIYSSKLVYLIRDSLTLVSCYLWSSILYCVYTIKFFNTWIVSFSLFSWLRWNCRQRFCGNNSFNIVSSTLSLIDTEFDQQYIFVNTHSQICVCVIRNILFAINILFTIW